MSDFFKGNIKPCVDEVFSSWLNRGIASDRSNKFLAAQDFLSRLKSAHIDDCPNDVVLGDLSMMLKVPALQLKNLFVSKHSWTHLTGDRRYFCEHCVLDGIATGRGVIIKKSWMSCWYASCEMHNVPMSYLKGTKAFSATNISNAIIKNESDFRLLLNGYYSGKCTQLERRYKIRRWSICGLIHIANAAQHWLSSLFLNYDKVGSRTKLAQVVEVLNLIVAVAARKQIKPYESKTLVSSLVPRARTSSCYFTVGSNDLRDRSLDVNLSHADCNIRISTIAMLGVALSLPRCTALWNRYISIASNELWAFRDVPSKHIRPALFYSSFCDYGNFLQNTLEKVDPEVRIFFRRLWGQEDAFAKA